MKFLVRYPKANDERPRWLVAWLHSTEDSSWWSETVVTADSAEAAAAKLPQYVDIDRHTSHRDQHRMRVVVYGPIPEDSQEFTVAKSTKVEPA